MNNRQQIIVDFLSSLSQAISTEEITVEDMIVEMVAARRALERAINGLLDGVTPEEADSDEELPPDFTPPEGWPPE